MDGHRDFKTTLIYADYMPGEREADLVNAAFERDQVGINSGINLSETEVNSQALNPLGMREAA
jgi:hypothetical protein